jgi:hypothetical protein
VPESNENNNTKMGNQVMITAPPPPLPDLTPTAVAGPTTGQAGQTAQVTATAQNVGLGAAPGGWLGEIRLSLDQVCVSSAVDPDALVYTEAAALSAGASTTSTRTATIPASITPGTYFWCVILDPAGGTVPESNENNNTKMGNQVMITAPPPPLPDLTPTAVAGPATGQAGQTAQVTVTAQNIGTGMAPGGWLGEIRLSLDQVCVSSAVDPDALVYTEATALTSGASTTATRTATIPASITPGTYFWCVILDPAGGTLTESNESNNTWIGNQITITAPLPTPIVWYPFSGNATDFMGSGLDGTVTGASLTADRYGVSQRAYAFNGSSDYITFGSSPTFDVAGPTREWSVALWMRYTQGGVHVMSRMNNATNGWNINVYPDGHIAGRLDGGSTNSFNMATTQSYMDGVWHLVYVRWNAAALTPAGAVDIWVDGVQQATTQRAGSYSPSQGYNTSSELVVGRGASPDTWFSGALDEVRLYGRALSHDEIRAVFAAER